MSDKKLDVALVTRDAGLSELIGAHRPAHARLMRVSRMTQLDLRLQRARQWWFDLDCVECPPAGLCERRVYFYSQLPPGADNLPPGLFIRKPANATAVAALWSDIALAQRPSRQTRFVEDRLPAWILDFHELDVRKFCQRAVTLLPERFGYAGLAVYGVDRERRSLTLLETNISDPIDFSVRLDATPTTDLFATVMREGRRLTTADIAETCAARLLRAPEQAGPRRRTAALLAPLIVAGEPVGLLYFRDLRPSEATEVGLPLDLVTDFLARSLRAAQAYEIARAEARVDCLTGLFNYRWMLESVGLEIERSKRFGSPLSLVLIDLDDMKLVNDAHGHLAGDTLLCHVAGKIRSILRQIDSAARIGGDEFIVLLPGADTEGARHMADRLLAALRDDPALLCGQRVPIRASVGIAQWQTDWGVRELTEAADAAMYNVKRVARVCATRAAAPAEPGEPSALPRSA